MFEWQWFSEATILPIVGVFIVGVLVGALIAVLVFKT